jgi:hypothetical protein
VHCAPWDVFTCAEPTLGPEHGQQLTTVSIRWMLCDVTSHCIKVLARCIKKNFNLLAPPNTILYTYNTLESANATNKIELVSD